MPNPALNYDVNAIKLALSFLDYAGVFVFAATGALAAIPKKQDILTFCFFAIVTGLGGGTLRDLLINSPVFWIEKPFYFYICVIAACVVWLLGKRGWRFSALLWLDALGISAFCIVGTQKTLMHGIDPVIAIFMGVITSVSGGIFRELLAHEENLLLRREIYITATLAGSLGFVALQFLHISFWPSAIFGFFCSFLLRAAAIKYKLALPEFNMREDAN